MDRTIRLSEHANGHWHFQPIAANGEPQASSEPYSSKSNAKRGAADLFPHDVLTFEEAPTDANRP